MQTQLNLNGSRTAEKQSQMMRAIRRTVTFTSPPRRERCLLMKSRTGLSLLISMQMRKNAKTPSYRRFLGELTNETKSKEVEERLELEIMAKTPYSGNKNIFSPLYIDDKTFYIRVFFWQTMII